MEKPDKRNEILQAALELITKNGFHGAPIAMISERSDVAVGTIYRYFANKDVLINDLYKELERKITVNLLKGYFVDKPFRERFFCLGTILLQYFITHPLHFRYMEQYHNSPYGASMRMERLLGNGDDHDIFSELFAEGIAGQVLKNVPFTVLFSLSFSPLLALARDHILGFIFLDDALIKQTVEACWDSVRR